MLVKGLAQARASISGRVPSWGAALGNKMVPQHGLVALRPWGCPCTSHGKCGSVVESTRSELVEDVIQSKGHPAFLICPTAGE